MKFKAIKTKIIKDPTRMNEMKGLPIDTNLPKIKVPKVNVGQETSTERSIRKFRNLQTFLKRK
jgi:hypothetical protein